MRKTLIVVVTLAVVTGCGNRGNNDATPSTYRYQRFICEPDGLPSVPCHPADPSEFIAGSHELPIVPDTAAQNSGQGCTAVWYKVKSGDSVYGLVSSHAATDLRNHKLTNKERRQAALSIINLTNEANGYDIARDPKWMIQTGKEILIPKPIICNGD